MKYNMLVLKLIEVFFENVNFMSCTNNMLLLKIYLLLCVRGGACLNK